MLTLYIACVWLIRICYGFVLISSAAGQNEADLFPVGEVSFYEFQTTVLLNENSEGAKNVGFSISGEVAVQGVWSNGDDKLLKFELRAPRLHIRSRKAPSPEGFTQHSSKLDEFPVKPFLVNWRSGEIVKLLLPKEEPISLANLKKGITSLFQFQNLNLETNETDSSGFCTTIYHTIDATKFEKSKTKCIQTDLPHRKSTDTILDVNVMSTRRITYELDLHLNRIKSIYAQEDHKMVMAVREDLGSVVHVDQLLNFVKSEKGEIIEARTLDGALAKIAEGYSEESLLIRKEEDETKGEEGNGFANVVRDLSDNIASKNLGKLTSANAFLRLLDAARTATREEISKVLGSKKNKKILLEIYDILGYVQSPEVHSAVMKKLHFDKEDHLKASERYLLSLSLSSQPNFEIVKDLLDRHRKNDNFPEKVKDTLILTIAAMAHSLNTHHPKLVRDVEEIIVNNLHFAKGDKRYPFLRALKNLRSDSTIPLLLETIKTGTNKEGVLAYKALKALNSTSKNDEVRRTARRTFLQLDRRYDTSARTLAVDILLEFQPNDDTLKDLLYFLKTNDSSHEVKQYVMQRLQMVSDEDQSFKMRVLKLIKEDSTLNNYKVLAPKGLSTALKRSFVKSSNVNGSLLTIQEILGGIVKRGIVNVMLEKNGVTKEMFSLGIFAGGLSSLMGGDTEDDEETATAGMELTILDRQIRPFVFFSGQGELMGHVWSGTASERTTAFQSLILLQDHLEFIRLGAGFVAELNLKTGLSFDLAGNIEISIWSRSADSTVEKAAGIVTNGMIAIDTPFVRSQIEFSASVEPKLHLKSDIDFSGNMNLCMRVTQPDSTLRHSIFKIERIPGSKHKMRISKYKKTLVPGTTYSLNRKNNEMCSAMLS